MCVCCVYVCVYERASVCGHVSLCEKHMWKYLAGVGLAAEAVHGDADVLVRLLRDRPAECVSECECVRV